jgi:hypothetical protein
MKKRIISNSCMFLFAISIFMLTCNPLRAQTQTNIAHITSDSTASLILSEGALDTAFEQDCNYDSASNFHGAVFTTVTLDEAGGTWYLEGFGRVSSLSITRGMTLSEDTSTGNLRFEMEPRGGQGTGGTCETGTCSSSCEVVGPSCSCGLAEDGGGEEPACTWKSGGSLGGYIYIIPWGGARATIGPGYLGNLF